MSLFALHDEAVLRDIIAAHPLAALVTAGPEGLDARHLPLLLRGGTLVGHMARANPLATRDGAEVLAIFRAAEAYVSPNLYASKAEHGRVVPTWNYVVAHAHGRLRIIDDPAWVRAQIGELTDAQEAGRAHSWKVEDAPADYIEKNLRPIVGVELDVSSVEAKAKLSQNRSDEDRAGVGAGLAADGREPHGLVAP